MAKSFELSFRLFLPLISLSLGLPQISIAGAPAEKSAGEIQRTSEKINLADIPEILRQIDEINKMNREQVLERIVLSNHRFSFERAVIDRLFQDGSINEMSGPRSKKVTTGRLWQVVDEISRDKSVSTSARWQAKELRSDLEKLVLSRAINLTDKDKTQFKKRVNLLAFGNLDADDFQVREKASKNLTKLQSDLYMKNPVQARQFFLELNKQYQADETLSAESRVRLNAAFQAGASKLLQNTLSPEKLSQMLFSSKPANRLTDISALKSSASALRYSGYFQPVQYDQGTEAESEAPQIDDSDSHLMPKDYFRKP